MSYSIWVAPKGPLFDRLHIEIKHLASTSGLAGAPTFLPHVTLVGGVHQRNDATALANSRELAQKLSHPFEIAFDKVSIGDHFHQCIFLLCQRSEELLRAAALAKSTFGLDPSSHYMPHLSLVYADAPTSTKDYIAVQLQASLLENRHGGLPAKSFTATTMQLWFTPAEDTTLESWKMLAEIPIGG